MIRHGDYTGGGFFDEGKDELTEEGIEVVSRLAATLAEQRGTFGMLTIVSSPLNRAVETAEIISKSLGTPFGTHPALDREAQVAPNSMTELPDFPETMDLVQQLGMVYDTVMLVTHAGCACCFLMYYAVHELGLPQEPWPVVEKGYGQVLNCTDGTFSSVCPQRS